MLGIWEHRPPIMPNWFEWLHIDFTGFRIYDWYVDSVNGSDSNDGRTPATPFQTIAALEAVGISANDTIGLARGSHWREQLDLAVNNISIASYGTGNRPLLDCSDIMANASFAKTGGLTNVYEISITPEWKGLTEQLNVFEDAAFLTKVDDTATCDATAGSFYPSAASGTITLYVHASDSSDVTANGKLYEFTKRQFAIQGETEDAINITGIHTRRNLGYSGSIKGGTNWTLTDCRCEQGNSHNCLLTPPFAVTDCEFVDAYIWAEAAATLFVGYRDVANGEDATLTNCAFSMSSTTMPNWDRVAACNMHRGTSGDFGTATLMDCTFTTFNLGVSPFNSLTNISILNATFTNVVFGIKVPGQPAPGCIFTVSGGTFISNLTSHALIQVNTVGTTVVVENMTITASADATTNVGLIFVTQANNVTVQDCHFVSNRSSGNRIAIYNSNAGANLTLRRNDYNDNLTWTYFYYFPAGASGMVWASDFNTFDLPFTASVFGTAYNDFAVYKAATSQDANSTAV